MLKNCLSSSHEFYLELKTCFPSARLFPGRYIGRFSKCTPKRAKKHGHFFIPQKISPEMFSVGELKVLLCPQGQELIFCKTVFFTVKQYLERVFFCHHNGEKQNRLLLFSCIYIYSFMYIYSQYISYLKCKNMGEKVVEEREIKN